MNIIHSLNIMHHQNTIEIHLVDIYDLLYLIQIKFIN